MALVLSLVQTRVSGVAPCAVVFDASGTTDSATAFPFHECFYEWDFGDTSAGVWAAGSLARSRNRATGPLAGHVFETPGAYTVTLRVLSADGATVATTTTAVTATDPDVVYAGALTYCISNGTDFSGAPVGAVQVPSIVDPLAWWNANSANFAGKRLLFKRGDTFLPSANLNLAKTGGIADGYVDSWGEGALPIFVQGANGQFIFASTQAGNLASNNCNNWQHRRLAFTGNGYTSGRGVAITASGTTYENVLALAAGYHTVSDCRFDAIANAALPCAAGYSFYRNDVNGSFGPPSGDMPIFAGGVTYCMLAGNDIDSNRLGEHNIRVQGFQGLVVEQNNLHNPADNKHNLTTRGTVGSVCRGAVISGNYLYDAHAFPANSTPQNTTSNEPQENIIWEKNIIGRGRIDPVASLVISASLVTVRNNIIDSTTAAAGTKSIAVLNESASGLAPPDNVWVYNNTEVNMGAGGLTALIVDGKPADPSLVPVYQTTWKNNLGYAPATTQDGMQNAGPDMLFQRNQHVSTLVPIAATNSSDVQLKTTLPFAATPVSVTPATVGNLRLNQAGYAKDGGASAPVWDDFFGRRRFTANDTACDMGAIETTRAGYRYGTEVANVV